MNTLFIGKVLLEYERLDSTNSQAQRLLKDSKPAEGTVILTMNQFAGRGQMGNEWFNDTFKNLTMSVVLYPGIDFPRRQFALNQVVALGLRDCLSAYCKGGVRIKWPNDIFVDGRKIAGVLIQNSISKHCIAHSIIGIGINVNQEFFPAGIGRPTSVYRETNERHDLMEVLFGLCNSMEAWYLKLKSGKFTEIDLAYHSGLYMKGEQGIFRDRDQNVFEGTIMGVSREGLLRVDTSEGVRLFMFKEISLV